MKTSQEKLTLTKLKDMYPYTVFASGVIHDSPDGVNIASTGEKLRWVAVRGGIHDWVIYAQLSDWPEELVRTMGDKITGEENIKKLVPCTDSAFKMYRY